MSVTSVVSGVRRIHRTPQLLIPVASRLSESGTTTMTKRCLDISVALLVLLVTAPVLVVVAVAIRIVMGRPVLFRQQRAGKDGIPFTLIKFRTMRPPLRPGAEYDDDDERLTRLGRLLRTTSVDELPTLANVLRGEMSLVGPRPLPVEYNHRYSALQRRRLAVVPGVTGLAQVNGRNALSWEEKFQLDVRYVETQSVLLDLTILIRTVSLVLRHEGIAMEGHTSSPRFLGGGIRPDGTGGGGAQGTVEGSRLSSSR